MRAFLRGPEWTRLQLHLTIWPHTLGSSPRLGEPIHPAARGMLGKMWKKANRLGSRLDELDAGQRHELRKALKKLRYAAEFFAPLFVRRDAKRFVQRLKKLQDVFGTVNDAQLARHIVDLQLKRKDAPEAIAAAGYTAGRLKADAPHIWNQAADLWRDLERAPRFWSRK